MTAGMNLSTGRWRRLPGLDAILVLLGFAVFGLIVFATQNRVVGWEPGYNELQPKHHGWVSSHTLAIIAHATPANAFVGYAEASIDENGEKQYDYFDRYPVFFSVGMHTLLSLKSRLSTQIYLAKQAMNGVFLLTVIVAYLLVRKLTGQTLASFAVAVASFSSPYLLFYKDMVHYDQPALLGILILIYAIALAKIDNRRRVVYGAALLSVSLGRGYASYAVLATWVLLEALPLLRMRDLSWSQRWVQFVRLDAVRAFLLAIGWGAACLLYNTGIEAYRRGVPFVETSIVQSAINRLALSEGFNESYLRILNWRTFLLDQVIRVVRWSFPVWEYEGSAALSAAIVAAMLIAVTWHARRLEAGRRMVVSILAGSGVVWLFAMRNLSAFHDYTAMYYLGIPLAFYSAVASRLRLPRLAWIAVVLLSLVVFTRRDLEIQDLHTRLGQPFNTYTHDFMRMAEVLPGPGQSIEVEDGVPYAPYAFGFYLPGDFQASGPATSYVISRRRGRLPDLLTPDNGRLFLFER
ncbi:MAG: hypothetical protein A2Z17_04780 [Gammaproteobacteria bacterium RBG_16_66_13]|nr:MAG: hypothetical protein A2Z17_04780 [Gammaproteobacteria bacterium RBG_16_66_13]